MLPSAAGSPRRWSSFGQQAPTAQEGFSLRRPSEAASLASQAMLHSSGTCSPEAGPALHLLLPVLALLLLLLLPSELTGVALRIARQAMRPPLDSATDTSSLLKVARL